jgi:hypothetical protein
VRLDPALDRIETAIARRHGLRVAAVLSGDDHHYARYSPTGDGPQRVTCGGGGAFLHPTDHVPDRLSVASRAWAGEERDDEYTLAALEPTRGRSRVLRLRSLWFGFRNGWVPAVTALAYLLWLLPAPGRVVGVLAVLGALSSLTRLATISARLAWGALHTAGHLGVMVLAVEVADAVAGEGGASVWGIGASLLLAGAVAGPVVFGLYFVVAGTVAGVNDNEAFSAVRVRGHKAFLRLHLDRGGHLHLHALGIRDVPGRSAWRLAPDAPPGGPWFAPVDGRGPALRLVDGPVELG